MATIKEFADGSFIEQEQGNFDEWCVYLTRPNLARHRPRDSQYFERLTQYAQVFGPQKVYDDFVAVYDQTTGVVEASVLDEIDRISAEYGEMGLDVSIDFTILYLGMIAENNKQNTRLGKRIKRLGVHQVLIEGIPYNEAADYSRGLKWRDIDDLCRQRGF